MQSKTDIYISGGEIKRHPDLTLQELTTPVGCFGNAQEAMRRGAITWSDIVHGGIWVRL